MASLGMDMNTGKTLHGDACIEQAIRRLLLTDHSLVLRRHLSSGVPPLVGSPMNEYELGLVQAAIAKAILEGEPRADLQAVEVGEVQASGEMTITIEAKSRESGRWLKIAWERNL